MTDYRSSRIYATDEAHKLLIARFHSALPEFDVLRVGQMLLFFRRYADSRAGQSEQLLRTGWLKSDFRYCN